MKKISRTIIALLLAVCMLVPGYASSLRASAKGSVDPTAGMVGNDHARIDQITVAGRTCYMYVPDSNRVGNFPRPNPCGGGLWRRSLHGGYRNPGLLFRAGLLRWRSGMACASFLSTPRRAGTPRADANAAAELYAGIYDTYSSRPSLKLCGW